jgi:UPF0176 protein
MTLILANFYKFVRLADWKEKKPGLLAYCQEKSIKGTILLAQEGINGAIAGLEKNVTEVLNFLRCDPLLVDLEIKTNPINELPFQRMKIKLKKEIVTIGVENVDPNDKVGVYIEPENWNQLINDPEVVLIDTRNEYEFKIGTFRGAKNPHIHSFRQFPEYIHNNLEPQKAKKVALFCTGGIRCEKATSLMLNQGFEEVYHLKGGILKYLEKVPQEQSLWEGECFVFDERVAVKNGLAQGSYQMCNACGHPISEEDKQSPLYQENISCPNCYGKTN